MTGCLLTAIERSALYSTTICSDGVLWVGLLTSSGRLTSTPFWLSGSAAMKMMSRTSSTSMSGVTFISELACGVSPLTTRSAPKCLWACFMAYFPPTGGCCGLFGIDLRVGDEADVLDPGLPEVVHRRHDCPIRGVGIALDEHDAFGLLLEGELDAIGHLRSRHLDGVDVELVARIDGENGLLIVFGLVRRVGRQRQLDVDASLQHRRHEHHDDEQHQHDVDERRDVDLRLWAVR